MFQHDYKQIILEKVKSNPDLFYYIDNKYIEELVDLIADGVSEAVRVAIKDYQESFKEELNRTMRGMGHF